MANSFRIKPNHVIVLDLLGQGKTQEEIASILGRNKSSVSRMVKRIQEHGLVRNPVRTNRKIFSLENDGYNVVKAVREQVQTKSATSKEQLFHQVGEKSNFPGKPKMEFRLHALLLEFPLVSPINLKKSMRTFRFEDHPTLLKDISNPRLRELYSEKTGNGHTDLIFDYKDFTVTLTTRTLIITDLRIVLPFDSVHNAQELFTRVIDIISPEIAFLESRFQAVFKGFHIKKGIEGLNSSYVLDTARLEIALTNDGLAVKAGQIQKETGEKLRVYNNQGELDWIVDFSTGAPEIESVNRDPGTALRNMEIYNKFLKDLTAGYFAPEKMSQAIGALHDHTLALEKNNMLQEQRIALLEKQLEKKDAEISEMKELMGEFINKFGNTALVNQQQIGQLARQLGGIV